MGLSIVSTKPNTKYAICQNKENTVENREEVKDSVNLTTAIEKIMDEVSEGSKREKGKGRTKQKRKKGIFCRE